MVRHMSVEEEVYRDFVHDDHTLGQENPTFGRWEHKDGVTNFNWHGRFVGKKKEVGKKM